MDAYGVRATDPCCDASASVTRLELDFERWVVEINLIKLHVPISESIDGEVGDLLMQTQEEMMDGVANM